MRTLFSFRHAASSRRYHFGWVVPYLFLFVVLTILSPLAAAGSTTGPKADTYFRYDYAQAVDSGDGEYYEYTEETKGSGKYTIKSNNGNEVTFRANYYWDYSNSEYESKHGGQDVIVSFNIQNRHYTSVGIDLDDPEYLSQNAADLCQWIWIPTNVHEGQMICILDENWQVTNLDAHIWSLYTPKHDLIEVTVRGTGSRNDDYGQFTYSYRDKLYFDKSTGMFVAERYDEWDTGTYNGLYASFHMNIMMDVTESSYAISLDWLMILGIFFTVLLIFLGIAYLIYRIRWRARTYQVKDLYGPGLTNVKVRRIWKKGQFPCMPNNATDFFGPYLQHLAEKALVSGDRVAVAINPQYGLVGVAFYVKEGQIGTVLCKHTELTELLRAFVGCKDFFTEMKHAIAITPEMQQDPYLMSELNRTGTQAYNVFETHNVYQLTEIRPMEFDADVVRPMTEHDIPIVIELAQQIYRIKAKRWITGNMKAGDLGYVAVVDNRIVGFGFACVCGRYGRLHTLGVDPAYRGRGIAKDLHRARLEVMRLMGVTTVIDEIADWNLASIRISSLSGFQPIGKMYVETVRTKRIKKDIVRR